MRDGRQEVEALLMGLRQERERLRREAERLSRWAVPLLRAYGEPCPFGGDGDALSLALAYGNGELVDRGRWCRCPERRPGRLFYWARRGGGHGWGCSRCLGVVQVG